MFKSVLTGIITGFTLVSVAHANVPTITFEGSIDTQLGVVKQDSRVHEHDSFTDRPFEVIRNYALVNDTHIWIKAQGKINYCEYGGEIKLNSDTSATKDDDINIAEKTMGYVSNRFGRVEFGSYTGASLGLQVSAVNIARATGGINGDARYWWNDDPGDIDYPRNTYHDLIVDDIYLTVPQLYTNNPVLVGIKDVNASKITYYTPQVYGLKAGVSYISDLGSYGTVFRALQEVFRDVVEESNSLYTNPSIYSAAAYKHVFEGGIRYDMNRGPFALSTALIGQTGTPKLFFEGFENTPHGFRGFDYISLHRLKAWEAGGAISYKNMTIAGAYGNNGKSGQMFGDEVTLDAILPTWYWNIGAAYATDKLGISATYMQSYRGVTAVQTFVNDTEPTWQMVPARPKFSLFSLGADYKIAVGAVVYAEWNWFKMYGVTDSLVEGEDELGFMSNNGHIVLLGTKIRF